MPPISLSYIKSALQRGETKEQIKSSLRLQGISEQEIDTAFNSLGSEKPESPNKEFLASNVTPSSAPVGATEGKPSFASQTPPSPSPPPPPSPQSSPTTENRMQYNAPQSSKSWFWPVLIVIFLIVLGASVAGYYYFDEIKSFAVSKYKGIFGSVEIEEPTPSPTPTPTPTPTVPEPPVLSGDELKLDEMNDLILSLSQSFIQNGSYPATLEITDPDGFYCYRNNGAHFVLGTTLDSSDTLTQTALADDLDGSYLCGETVKECADPIYCVGP